MMEKKSSYDCQTHFAGGIEFHDRLANGWSQGYVRGYFARRLSLFVPILDRNVMPGKNWLDLGCGSGVLTRELLIRNAKVAAVDGSPNMLMKAKESLNAYTGASVNWLLGDVVALDRIDNSSFDGILCSSVIEYVDEPDALLVEAARVLRPGGRLIISIPPRHSIVRTVQKYFRVLGRILGKEIFSYLQVSRFEMDPKYLDHWLSDHGFTLDRVTNFDPIISTHLTGVLRPALMVAEAHKKWTSKQAVLTPGG